MVPTGHAVVLQPDQRGAVGELPDPHPDFAQRETPLSLLVESPTVGIPCAAMVGEVGLKLVGVLVDQGQQRG